MNKEILNQLITSSDVEYIKLLEEQGMEIIQVPMVKWPHDNKRISYEIISLAEAISRVHSQIKQNK